MDSYYSEQKMTVEVRCPACGRRGQGTIAAKGQSFIGFFDWSGKKALQRARQRASAAIHSILEDLESGSLEPFKARKGIALRCDCGYRSVNALWETWGHPACAFLLFPGVFGLPVLAFQLLSPANATPAWVLGPMALLLPGSIPLAIYVRKARRFRAMVGRGSSGSSPPP